MLLDSQISIFVIDVLCNMACCEAVRLYESENESENSAYSQIGEINADVGLSNPKFTACWLGCVSCAMLTHGYISGAVGVLWL